MKKWSKATRTKFMATMALKKWEINKKPINTINKKPEYNGIAVNVLGIVGPRMVQRKTVFLYEDGSTQEDVHTYSLTKKEH